jgi:hypothetical protein
MCRSAALVWHDCTRSRCCGYCRYILMQCISCMTLTGGAEQGSLPQLGDLSQATRRQTVAVSCDDPSIMDTLTAMGTSLHTRQVTHGCVAGSLGCKQS